MRLRRLNRDRPTLILLRSDAPHAVPPALPRRQALMLFTAGDGFYSHPKISALSLSARGLFASAGSWSAHHQMDGVVPGHQLAALGGTPAEERELIIAGLACRAKGGGIRITDFRQWLVPGTATPAPLQALAQAVPAATRKKQRGKSAGARKQALNRAEGLKAAVRERDGGRCRYCAVPVEWGTGRAASSGTYDFIDPDGPATEANVVTACMACRTARGGKPLAGSGTTLLPAPGRPAAIEGVRAEGVRPPSPVEPQARRGTGTPSRTPSRKGYGSEGTAQKGYTTEIRTPSTVIDRSDQDLYLRAGKLNPDQDQNQDQDPVSDHDRNRAPGVVAAVVEALWQKGHQASDDEALFAITVLETRAEKAGTVIHDPVKYFPAAAKREADIAALLPVSSVAPDAESPHNGGPPPWEPVATITGLLSPSDPHCFVPLQDDPYNTGSCAFCAVTAANKRLHPPQLQARSAS